MTDYCIRKKIEQQAACELIREQKCSKIRNDYFTVPCYGFDLLTLDTNRKWLYEQELEAYGNKETARIYANKIVLYVNREELDRRFNRLMAAAQ